MLVPIMPRGVCLLDTEEKEIVWIISFLANIIYKMFNVIAIAFDI